MELIIIGSLLAIFVGVALVLPSPGGNFSAHKDGPRNPPKGPTCIPAKRPDR